MSPPDLLQLRHLRALEVVDHADHYLIRVDGQGEPSQCPQCNAIGMYRHGVQTQRYMDVPMHGKRVMLEIERRRYRCRQCGKTLLSSLPEMDGKRLATSRLVHYIERNALSKTFAELAREVGVDEKTIRHVFDDYVDRLKAEVRFETPRILGIDELKIIGKYRAMITNIEALSLYDMLPTRNKVDLVAYFKKLPDKHKVEVVTMDLWSVYRQVAKEQLPGRMIVADRWHVVRMANDAVDRVRKAIRRTLDTRTRLRLKDDRHILFMRASSLSSGERELLESWRERFPDLVDAYWVKEAFHALYEQPSEADAKDMAQAWLQSIPEPIAWAFRETAHALESWWDEVFNHYQCRISNAYTESVNRLAKDMNRMGRGYSFEVIRARLVYDQTARSKTTQSVRQRAKPAAPSRGPVSMGRMTFAVYEAAEDKPKLIEYGPHIPTLCDLLESGHFER